jgi:fructosamine-3-kinase
MAGARDEALRRAVESVLGSPVRELAPLAGGDISRAYRLQCADGRRLFLKTHPNPPPGLYGCEAAGLGWLGEASALGTPAVIACSDGTPAFLVLEWIERGQPGPAYDDRLGRGLAELHRFGAARFGLDHDNYIALITQPNAAAPSWPEFYAARRLEPLLQRSADRGQLSRSMRDAFERVLARLPTLCGPAEPPARLHGDLWSGNVMVDCQGLPVLIDPAAYAGQREVDLAMMALFGGFSPRCFAAYAEAFPLQHGHAERVALYQLYPLLVHVNLFGASYLGALERTLASVA